MFTVEQFREYLNLLKGITYKLLLKRHIDVAIDMHEKIHKEDVDYLDGTTAGDILAKVRFKNTKETLWQYAGTMPSASEYNCDVVFSDEMMDSNPRYWTIGQLIAGIKELEKCRTEFFGDESTTEPSQTSAEKKAATVQATLAVFKSVFAQLPSEQPPPAAPPAAEPLPNPMDSLPPECRRRTKKVIPEDISDILERIRATSFEEVAKEILRKRMKDKSSADGTLAQRPSQEHSTVSKTEPEITQEPVKSSKESSNKEKTTGEESHRKSTKLFKKNKTPRTNSLEDETTLKTSLLSDQSLDKPAEEHSSEDSIDKKSTLDIPIVTKEPKTSLTFSDSLSDVFSPNQVSVLSRPGSVKGDVSNPNSPSMEDIRKHIFVPNIDSTENELLEGKPDEHSEPDKPDDTEPPLSG